jgi:hypothetical protein
MPLAIIGTRIKLDRLFVVWDGEISVALHSMGDAAIVVGWRKFRIELDHLAIVCDGAINVALLKIGDTAVEVGLRIGASCAVAS